MKKAPNRGYYFAYSREVYRHLKQNGFSYICTGLHTESKKQFYLFKQTDQLSEALSEYSELQR
jgi:hypothetical protein